MTQELREKIRDTLSIAYQVGFTHKSAGNTAYLEVEAVLDALMDSIVLADNDKVEIPKPDHIAEVDENIVWREHYNGETGCAGCICRRCIHGSCGEHCKYNGEMFDCTNDHTDEVIKECKYYEEME